MALGVPIVRVNNFSDGRLDLTEVLRVAPEVEAKYTRTRLKGGEVLLTLVGSVGQVATVPPDCVGFNVARAVGVIRPANGYGAKWLAICLQSPLSQFLLGSRANTTVQTTINLKDVRALPVPIPPPQERARIIEMVGALDDRIALLRETNATLEAIAQALFKSWFVDFDPVRAKSQGLAPAGMDEATAGLFPDSFEESALGLVPTGWGVFRLGDVVSRITKGTTPTTLKRPFVPAGVNFVKAESMTDDGGFLPEKFAFIDAGTHELLRRSQLASGDVLISIAGTIGRTAVMTDDFLPANTNQAVALIRPLPDVFPSGLIIRFLQRVDSRQLMGERVVQAVQANLSLGTLSDMQVVLPPPNVTRRLCEAIVCQVDARKALNQQCARTLAALRDTLLPRLISGQLRLPEAIAEAEEVL